MTHETIIVDIDRHGPQDRAKAQGRPETQGDGDED